MQEEIVRPAHSRYRRITFRAEISELAYDKDVPMCALHRCRRKGPNDVCRAGDGEGKGYE